MPTGYTDRVASGDITDFKSYALACMRSFGACVTLRDEPLDGNIPKLEPSEYYSKSAERNRIELDRFLFMTSSKRKNLYREHCESTIKEAEDNIERINKIRKRYEDMLIKAKKFVPPTKDHEKYAEFLVSQLEESIRFDCDTSYYIKLKRIPKFEDWEDDYIKQRRSDIEYHTRKQEEENQRVNSRNRWIDAVKEALEGTKGD